VDIKPTTEQEQVATPDLDDEEIAFQKELEADDATFDAAPEPVSEKGSESLTGTPAADDDVAEDVRQEEAEPERVEVIPGYTEEEVKEQLATIAKLRKSLDTTNGTFGSKLADMQRKIDALTAPRQSDADKPKPVPLSKDKFKRLKEEFPELAELLAQDLGDILQPGAAPDLDGFKSEFEQRLAKDRQEVEQKEAKRELRLLSREHPDWKEVAAYSPAANGLVQWHNPAFGAWIATQPEDVQNTVLHGRDAFEVADTISAYKATLKTQPAVKKQTNLTKAIQPRGAATNRASSLDEEERLFREELAKEEL